MNNGKTAPSKMPAPRAPRSFVGRGLLLGLSMLFELQIVFQHFCMTLFRSRIERQIVAPVRLLDRERGSSQNSDQTVKLGNAEFNMNQNYVTAWPKMFSETHFTVLLNVT